MLSLSKTRAFIRKDFLIESSYKVAFLITLISAVFPVMAFFFIGQMVSGPHATALERYGNNYFSFSLVGFAFSNYFIVAVNTFSTSMRRAQTAGCLEAIMSSQTGPASVVLMSSFYSFLSAGIQLVFVFLVGTLVLHFDFSRADLLAAVIVLFLSVIVFIAIGILSAAGTIVFKQGEPVGWIAGGISSILGGVYFPVSMMPGWLRFIAHLVPTTYSLDALRLAILQGYPLSGLSSQIIILALFAICLLPLSLYLFTRAIEQGKRTGTLMQY